jgi:hypothetical protein
VEEENIMGVEKEKLESYAVIEMMGHRKIVGKISESDIGGSALLKVSVLGKNAEPDRTEYIGIGSIYCLTIVTEEAAKAVAVTNAPEPTWAWGIKPQPVLTSGEYHEGEFEDLED